MTDTRSAEDGEAAPQTTPPSDRVGAISDVLTWVGASQNQIQRFLSAWEIPPSIRPNPHAWRSPVAFVEAHLLAVTAHHVVTAVDALPPNITVPALNENVRRSVLLLRNIWEHWNEQRPTFATKPVQSGKRYQQEFPGESPWSLGYSNDPSIGTRVGGVLQIELLTADLHALETVLQPQLEQAMHDVGLLPYNGPAIDFASPTGFFPTPEELATAGFEGRAAVAASIQHEDQAVVLVLAEVEPTASVPHAPWGVTARRMPAGWHIVSASGGTGGWGDQVAFSFRAAPTGCTSGRVRYLGRDVTVPVQNGWALWAEFGVEPPDEFIHIEFD